MKKVNLDKSDIELVNRIVKVTTTISNIYQKLCTLEVYSQKNSNYYKKLLNNLKIATSIEDELYERLNLNYEKLKKIEEYFFNNLEEFLLEDFEILINQDFDNHIFLRIKNILFNKFSTDYKSLKEDELIKQMKACNYENNIDIDEFITFGIIDKIIKKDVMDAYLVFLLEFIKKYDFNSYNNSALISNLINSKYNVIFLNKYIEADMIQNGFNITETTVASSKFIAETLNIDLNMYEIQRNDLGEAMCKIIFDKLLKLKNDYQKKIFLIYQPILFANAF